MFTRMADWASSLQFFIGKLENYLKGKLILSNESVVTWLKEAMDLSGGFFDNWVYLNRVNLRVWKNKWQEDWVDWLSSACCISFILLAILEKALKIYWSSVKELMTLGDICFKRDSSGGSTIVDNETDSSGTESP